MDPETYHSKWGTLWDTCANHYQYLMLLGVCKRETKRSELKWISDLAACDFPLVVPSGNTNVYWRDFFQETLTTLEKK